jgi:hypothetical protein
MPLVTNKQPHKLFYLFPTAYFYDRTHRRISLQLVINNSLFLLEATNLVYF